MRRHMAGMTQSPGGFVQCPEQQRLRDLLRDTVTRHGSTDPDTGYPLLRAEAFRRYGLEREPGVPPVPEGPGGTGDRDLSRFFYQSK